DTWHDPYEGFILKALRSIEGQNRIAKWLDRRGYLNLPSGDAMSILEYLHKTVHMQSWTKKEQSQAMWKLYHHIGETVRISTSVDKIKKLEGILIVPIKYKKLTLDNELSHVFKRNKLEYGEIFARKSKEYSHEEEIRLMSSIDLTLIKKAPLDILSFPHETIKEAFQSLVEMGAISNESLEDSMSDFRKKACIKRISIAGIDNFIESVMVPPDASNEFTEKVRLYCEANGLPFEGKSKLYQFELG
ncbi:MAG: hypothetical protein V4447_16800, partial [Pseudomonadota bacterium]